MKTLARLLVCALVAGVWTQGCGGGDEPPTIPITTGGSTGSQAAGTGGTYTGAAGSGQTTGAAGAGQTTGAAGQQGGAAGTQGAGTGGSGTGVGGAGMGAAGAGGGTTGAAGAGGRGGGNTGRAGMGGGAGTGGGAGMGGGAGTGGGAGMGGGAGTGGGAGMGGGAGTGGGAGMGGGAGTGGGGVSTKAQVQAILNANCTSCHGNSGGMSLADVSAVVGVASSECPAKMRIAAGSPQTSYLVDKVRGASQMAGGCFSGVRMPRGRAALSAANINTIVSWIQAGAN